MITLLFLSLVSVSHQELSDQQKKLCTSNDGGDPWKYDLTPLGLLKDPFQITDSIWTYHIALCGEANIEVTPELKNDAIVQVGNEKDKQEFHVVGTNILSRYGGEMWVNLVLNGGDRYTHHCNLTQRKAQIMFICDPDAGIGKPQLLDERNDATDFCFYMFEWPTDLVCPKNAKGAGNGGMGVFKLLLLELVVIVMVYLVLGVGYKRFVLGARGAEQIPNLAFWKSCREGVEATVDKVRNSNDVGGVRSDNISTNLVMGDDDERLIM